MICGIEIFTIFNRLESPTIGKFTVLMTMVKVRHFQCNGGRLRVVRNIMMKKIN